MFFLYLIFLSGALAFNTGLTLWNLSMGHPGLAAVNIAAAAFLLPLAIWAAVRTAQTTK